MLTFPSDSEGEDVKPVPAKKKTPTKQAKNGTAATRKAKVLVRYTLVIAWQGQS